MTRPSTLGFLVGEDDTLYSGGKKGIHKPGLPAKEAPSRAMTDGAARGIPEQLEGCGVSKGPPCGAQGAGRAD